MGLRLIQYRRPNGVLIWECFYNPETDLHVPRPSERIVGEYEIIDRPQNWPAEVATTPR